MKYLIALACLVAIAAPPAWAQDAKVLDEGRAAFTRNGCHGCHTIGRMGTPIGPDLSHVGAKYGDTYLQRWLRDPSAVRPTAHMPALELSEADVRALVTFFGTQR